MGLDQYLYGEIRASKDSPLGLIIEKYLTDENRAELAESEGYLYISGWSWAGQNGGKGKDPEPFYVALCEEMGFVPHSGSPHISLYPPTSDGEWRIRPIVMYWRKANAIHRWFVEKCQDGVDDCGTYPVHPEMLMDLLERCERITNAIDSEKQEFAEELLPTQGGFFFGGTGYDEWYFSDVKDTATVLREQVERLPRGAGLYYHSSW